MLLGTINGEQFFEEEFDHLKKEMGFFEDDECNVI